MPISSMGGMTGGMLGGGMPSMPTENTIPSGSMENTVTMPGGMMMENTVTSVPGGVSGMPSMGGNTSSDEKVAIITKDMIDTIVNMFVTQDMIVETGNKFGAAMTEASMQKTILTKVGELTGKLMEKVGSAFEVDGEKMASAFKFEMN